MKNSFPLWQELPELDLYLDQVLLYTNQVIRSAISPQDKPLTAAMVNNYVKHQLIAKPVKKKYQKKQLARLIVITLLKPVFAISDIARSIEALQQDYEAIDLYNSFVRCLNDGQEDTHPLISTACDTLKLYYQTLSLAHDLGDTTHE